MKTKHKWTQSASHILRWMHVFDSIDINKKILDFGSGPGYSLFVGIPLGYDIVGLDVKGDFQEYLSLFKKLRKALGTDKHTILYDTSKLPFEDKTFDIIICKAVLTKTYHYIDNQEFKRILKDDGIILVFPEKNLRIIKNIPEKNKGVLPWGDKKYKPSPSNKELYLELCLNAKERIEGMI